jgi:hypothetical protein
MLNFFNYPFVILLFNNAAEATTLTFDGSSPRLVSDESQLSERVPSIKVDDRDKPLDLARKQLDDGEILEICIFQIEVFQQIWLLIQQALGNILVHLLNFLPKALPGFLLGLKHLRLEQELLRFQVLINKLYQLLMRRGSIGSIVMPIL